MIRLLRYSTLIILTCLVPYRTFAQDTVALSETARKDVLRLPEEGRDTAYRRWGSHFYATYTEEGISKALACYTEALRIARKFHHEDVVRQSYYDLGSVYDAMNNYRKAREYYELVFADQLRLGDPKRIFRSAYNLATVASKADDRQRVRLYAAIMQKHLKSIRDDDFRLHGNLLLANLLSRNKDTTQFLFYYHMLPDNPGFADDGLAFGRLYAETKSNYLFFKGMGAASLEPLYTELKRTNDSVPLLTLLAVRLEETGDYRDALSIRKELDRKVSRTTSSTLRNDIEKRTLGMDNELMERKNQLLELQQLHLLQQRRQLYGITALLLIGFLIATYSFFRIKTQNQQIQSQSDRIVLQHRNIETLLREVHHRVKNNLQIINSVVELQQMKQEVSPADSLKEVQLKMQSIALAHELVYEQEQIEYVPLQDYFNRLFGIIIRIYNIPSSQLIYHVKMNDLKLNIDRALLLALAANELIINTLKHVYPHKSDCIVDLNCTFEGDRYIFCYKDNGPGLPPQLDPQKGTSIGLRLVRNLTKQLNATMEVKNAPGHLEYVFTFTP